MDENLSNLMNEKLSLINVTISQVICSTILVMLILDQHCFVVNFHNLVIKKGWQIQQCVFGDFLKNSPYLEKKQTRSHQI